MKYLENNNQINSKNISNIKTNTNTNTNTYKLNKKPTIHHLNIINLSLKHNLNQNQNLHIKISFNFVNNLNILI